MVYKIFLYRYKINLYAMRRRRVLYPDHKKEKNNHKESRKPYPVSLNFPAPFSFLPGIEMLILWNIRKIPEVFRLALSVGIRSDTAGLTRSSAAGNARRSISTDWRKAAGRYAEG